MNWKITTEQTQVKIYDFLQSSEKPQIFTAWVVEAENQINCYEQCVLEYRSKGVVYSLVLTKNDFQ